ncbi:GroES-like protein [Mytilinidion resinicola]|uniref:GroES-like protein n=1 Tax=Mytilinidion resinicola TaxID=574789 RepID=A0A6A6YNQ8_9PEZI|nr:GroES-like protein [Mytilinidion resinicola]KAF2810526.1 GroES-like protein [Mytilinidion resinicola]
MAPQNIPETMLAAQIVEFHKPYKLNTIPVPSSLAPHDLLIRTAVASLCHTDFMALEGIMNSPLPTTGSHEGSGTVAAVGSAVKDFAPGDRIMCNLLYSLCGQCVDCKGPENYSQYCTQHGGHLGITRDGNFAEYVRVDARTAVKLPDNLSFETAAPLACAGCTAYRGILQAKAELKPGEWIGIVGSGGGLGHLAVQFAKALGVKTVGIEARDVGIELTKKAGVDAVVDARIGNEKVVEEVKKITGSEGVGATVVLSDAKGAAALSCAITRMHGTVIQIAQPTEFSIPFQELVFRDIRVKGSLICSVQEARDMLELVGKHKISANTNAFTGLKELPKLFELAESGKMKGKGIIIVDLEQIKKEKESGLEMV